MKKNQKSLPKTDLQPKTENFKNVRKNLQKAIKEYVKEENMTMAQFAATKIFVSDRSLRNYINGETIPEGSLKLLCQVLGKSREYLLGVTIKDLIDTMNQDKLNEYKPVIDLLDDIGIQFHIKDDQLFMNPINSEPIPMDNDIYDFFIKRIRKYAKGLFTDYYNSIHAYKYRHSHILNALEKSQEKGQIEIEHYIDSETGKRYTKTYIDGNLKEGDAND